MMKNKIVKYNSVIIWEKNAFFAFMNYLFLQ